MRRTALALTLALLSSAALAQQVNDVQLRPGSSSLWGASFNANNNQDIAQFNTAGSAIDSFRWFQGTSAAQGTFLFSMSPTGMVAGAAIGSRQGPGTINAQGVFVNGVSAITGLGGTNGQIQYNNAGTLGGFTTSGDATINTTSGVLTLATVNANVGTFGSATTCITTTQNAKGLTTAISAATCTPALGSITGLGTGVPAALAINIGSAGAPVLFNGAGGTPSSMTGTNITGVPIATGISGLSAGCATALTTPTSVNLRACFTDETGNGLIYFQNGALGTPASGDLANTSNFPISGLSNAGTGMVTFLGTPSSANLRATITDESGTGALLFQNGDLGTPSAGVGTNLTALNATQITTGTLPTARLSLGQLTNSLAANVALNNISNYFDGPSIAQGSTGTWWAAGTVTAVDTAGAANIQCKLWDGTTVISSGQASVASANLNVSFALSGFIVSPVGNIRISCKDPASTSGVMVFNATGNSKDSTVSAFRIN